MLVLRVSSLTEMTMIQKLQVTLKETKVKLRSPSTAIQLALDLNHVIEAILNSEVAKEGKNPFRKRLLCLPELKKWRHLVNLLTEDAFSHASFNSLANSIQDERRNPIVEEVKYDPLKDSSVSMKLDGGGHDLYNDLKIGEPPKGMFGFARKTKVAASVNF